MHVVRREVRTRAEAEQLGFPGSPTFQVGRRDLFPADGARSASPAASTSAPTGAAPRCPTPPTLADRLRSALARPWDLPHWVDHRKPADR